MTQPRRVEDAVPHGLEQLQLISDNVPALISYVDRGFRYRWCNRAYTDWFGLPNDQLIGREMRDVLGEEAWRLLGPRVEVALAGEKVEFEGEAKYRTGGTRWVRAVYTPHRDATGAVLGVVIMVHDLTERRRQEQALRASEEKYRLLFDSIDEGFCTIQVLFDDQGKPFNYRFLDINPAFIQQTDLHDAVGKTMLDFAPEMEPHWFEIYGRVAMTGEPVRFENRAEQLHRWYDVYAFRVGAPEDRKVGVLFNDITARKRGEDVERRAAARDAFRVAVADALRPLSDPVDIQETAGRMLGEYLGASRVAYFELRGTEYVVERDYVNGIRPLAGRYPVESFGPHLLATYRSGRTIVVSDVASEPHLAPAEREAFAGIEIGAHVGVPLVKDGVFVAGLAVHARGRRVWTPEEIALAEETAERTWAAVERARAEAALQASQEKLQEADRRKDEFLAMLAHELRNPLAPIRTGLEIIRLAGDSPASVERVRTTMERQVGHMVRLIDDLLDVSRISSGKIQLQRKPTPLGELVNSAIEANRAALDAAHIQLRVDLSDEACLLDVDPTRMIQVLANLLHNAGKFTQPGGRIDVSSRYTAPTPDADDELEITVADDGIGISAEMLPRVFDLFTQGQQRAGDRTQPGLGIGLALARRLVEMHGGRIDAISQGLDQGSTFRIHVPVARGLAVADALQAGGSVRPVKRRVVVIDDNEDAAMTLAMLLDEMGSETRVAHHGIAGLQVIAEFRPDVVLLDIGMPGMDGYETCRRIRAGQNGSDLVIVALTGWGQEQDKKRAIDAGFDAHLTKPADPAVLERLLAAPRP